LLFVVTAIKNIDPNNNGRLIQYKMEMWLKTKSFAETVDKG